MVMQAPYKKYKRGQRQANVETNFKSGMMFSDGTIADGYVKTLVNFDYTADGRDALKPRASLRTCEFISPDVGDPLSSEDKVDYLDNDTTIKYSKECVENGSVYRQFIFGKPNVSADTVQNEGKIWVATSAKPKDSEVDFKVSNLKLDHSSSPCSFFITELPEIHGQSLATDAKAAFPVGCFLGNSFYFFNDASEGDLCKTEFDLGIYKFGSVTPKVPSASEAVNYGYNALRFEDTYNFIDSNQSSASFQMEGILPYDSKFELENSPQLLMTPRANSRVWFRCNYAVSVSDNYKIIWSWKEVSADEWTVFNTDWNEENPFNSTDTPILQADLICPSKEILVRCEAYNLTGDDPDAVERAMTVGFDFTIDEHGSTANITPEEYDLSTATGMISWKNRLCVWGLPKDPTILFISDLDEPSYFPYPNNITVFDEPIISVTELMDNLIVFTESKVHQVTLNTDGTSWTSEVIQSNLYIEPWDKHLIQSVRNMLYFKSGNYYYMIVPKAQSQTGELTLAPITTPITAFFNHFSVNVEKIFRDCFKEIDEDGNTIYNLPEELVTYYNFLDYESIHNFYVYKYQDHYVHFDIVYNVVDRYWKICVYESPHFLYPFRMDATQPGLLAGTSVMHIKYMVEAEEKDDRVIQLFKFDPLNVKDIYIPADPVEFPLEYWSTAEEAEFEDEDIDLTEIFGSYDGDIESLILDPDFIWLEKLDEDNLWFLGSKDYAGGFPVQKLYELLYIAIPYIDNYTTFSNKQMLDTGYRDAGLFVNKRYRELQIQLNNVDNVDMEFGMDFQISGEPRNTDFLYEVSQVIDEMKQDEGIAYIDATPYLPIESSMDDKIDKTNLWRLDHASNPDVSFWKVRAAISGKGSAPRLRLFSKEQFNYQLLGINWVYREMNMR